MIFGIGKNKTGTRSLACALESIGMTVSHSDTDNADRVRQLLSDPYWKPFDEFDVYLDGPLWMVPSLLREHFPDAKFILTTRDPDQWITSRMIHVLSNRIVYRDEAWQDLPATKADRDEFVRHNEDMREMFDGDPHFLEIDLTTGDQWAQLALFLDIPIDTIAGVEFPRRNSADWRIAQILKHLKANE